MENDNYDLLSDWAEQELWEDEIHVLGNGIKLALYAMEKNSEFQLLVEEVEIAKI